MTFFQIWIPLIHPYSSSIWGTPAFSIFRKGKRHRSLLFYEKEKDILYLLNLWERTESHPSQKSRMLSPRRVAKAVDGSKYRCRVIFNIRERPKKIRPFTEESLSHNNRVFSREYPIPNRVEPVGQALTQRKELKKWQSCPRRFWYLVEPKADAQKKQSEAYFKILTGDSILSSLFAAVNEISAGLAPRLSHRLSIKNISWIEITGPCPILCWVVEKPK